MYLVGFYYKNYKKIFVTLTKCVKNITAFFFTTYGDIHCCFSNHEACPESKNTSRVGR
jgi:hypothetical protein